MKITASRYHDFSCGHRVVGHESKCRHLHGHNYRVTVHAEVDSTVLLDKVGRVVDFSVLKHCLMYCEDVWDHRTLLWSEDPMLNVFRSIWANGSRELMESIVEVPFNPTAENMGIFLLEKMNEMLALWCEQHLGPESKTHVMITRVDVEETRKCTASVSLYSTDKDLG